MQEPSQDGLRTTGIGSLPHEDLGAAVRHVETAYDLPFRPQLPLGDGHSGMLAECLPQDLALAAHPGFGVKLIDLIEDPALVAAFEDADPAEAPIVRRHQDFLDALSPLAVSRPMKTQLVGPITILQTLRDGWSRPLFSAPELHPILLSWSRRLLARLLSVLEAREVEAVVTLDEPVLGLPGPAEAAEILREILTPLRDQIRGAGFPAALHCCSEPPLALLDELDFDLIYVDAHRFHERILADAPLIARMFARGRRLGLGVLPVVPQENEFEVIPFLAELGRRTGVAAGDLVRRLDLSASCGTLLAPLEREEEIAQNLAVLKNDIASWSRNEG